MRLKLITLHTAKYKTYSLKCALTQRKRHSRCFLFVLYVLIAAHVAGAVSRLSKVM